MTPSLQVFSRQLLWGCMACAPWWGLAQAQAQTLEALIQDTLATHPATQSQRAQVASATAGVDSARWQIYPTPSVAL
jgi:outer membrane protein TolC